jgi:hypothetical protein
MDWEPVGTVEPTSLVDARVQLHHAVQHVAAVGAALAPPAPDSSHKGLVYDLDAKRRTLRGAVVAGADGPWHAAFDIHAFRLLLVRDGAVSAGLDLPNHTDADVLVWLNEASRALGAAGPIAAHRYDDDFPRHAVGAGAPYGLGAGHAHLVELDRYFANSARLLADVRAREARAGPVRAWPHHLDLATLIRLDDERGEDARSIGVGFSPGDAGTPQPYWYVTPWPPGDPADLPARAPGLGAWQAEPFYGALLRAGDLPPEGARAQAAAAAFVAEAVRMGRQCVGTRPPR